MKFASYSVSDDAAKPLQHGWGMVDGEFIVPMTSAWPTLRDAIGAGSDAIAARAGKIAALRIALNSVTLKPPVPDPGKIFCIGLNYGKHIAETGRERPAHPSVFVRHIQSFVGHGSGVLRPWISEQFDYEAELTVVIGRAGRHIKVADAMRHVFGYTCAAENSVRDFQKHATQATAGKNFDDSGALGPYVVTADAAPPLSEMVVTGRLNGEQMQSAPVTDLIFSVPELIAYLSSFTALQPGDMILTGTPEGVGMVRNPPRWMNVGDVFEVDIQGVGRLSNPAIQENK